MDGQKGKEEMKIKGYTNRILRRTSLFGGGIVSMDKCLEEYNELNVRFCTAERHRGCSKFKQCQRCKPDCESDELNMVGKSLSENLTKADRKKIEGLLRSYFKKCRPIKIDIIEVSNTEKAGSLKNERV